MNPSDSRIETYKERAEDLVQYWLDENSNGNFVKTCEVCNKPLRDDTITDDRIIFIVTSLGAFMEHDSDVYYQCPKHNENPKRFAERLLMTQLVAITGRVRKERDEFVLEAKEASFYKN